MIGIAWEQPKHPNYMENFEIRRNNLNFAGQIK